MNEEKGVHPGELIWKRFIIPSGKSIQWWARNVSLGPGLFWRVIKREETITISISKKISKAFGDSPQRWIRMQNEFLLSKTLARGLGCEPVPKIKAREIAGTKNHLFVKEVLVNEYLRPMCLLSLGLARHIRIKNDVFRKYFSGSDGNFDYKVAGRLGEALGTSPKFWLDLQSKQDLNIYLQKNPLLAKYFDDWSPPKNADRTLHHYNSTPIHPGSILEKNFIQPSGIAILYWADFFCMNPRSLQRILSGKNLLDLKFISLLAKAFNTKASYWIELQNEYLSHQYFKQHSSKLKIEPIKPGIIIRRTHNPLLPGQILINRFLKPMNIPISEFTRHIGVNKNAVKHLTTGHNNIDLSLAVKLSQALGTTPMYWLDLQMKYDFSRMHTHGNQCKSTKTSKL